MAVQLIRLLCGAILAATVAGCANSPKTRGIPWWPQGPGNSTADLSTAASVAPLPSAGHTNIAESPSTRTTNRSSQAVRYGDLLFVSGQVAEDPMSGMIVGTNTQDQLRVAMDNVTRILESHGLAATNILSVTMYLRDIKVLPEANSVYASYFRGRLPAFSVVQVNGLTQGSLVEISVIAGQ